jgi:NADH dehydrogenase
VSTPELSVVTGASGYTGKYIARRLLAEGERVRTITGHPARPDPFGGRVDVAPMDFDDPRGLASSLEGATTLYNTYWIRFPWGEVTFERAVENSRTLIRAAEQSGVRRMVHISITGASAASPLPYFRGKGMVEDAIASSRLSHAIIRPTLVFGREDVLTNNIAWALRRLPVFPIFGSGDYRIQPVAVEDVAAMAVKAAGESYDLVVDAVGPETFTYDAFIRLIARVVGSRARLVHARPGLAHILTRLAGYLLRDVVLTRDEIDGLMAGLLASDARPTGTTWFSRWLEENAGFLGEGYISELKRHYR